MSLTLARFAVPRHKKSILAFWISAGPSIKKVQVELPGADPVVVVVVPVEGRVDLPADAPIHIERVEPSMAGRPWSIRIETADHEVEIRGLDDQGIVESTRMTIEAPRPRPPRLLPSLPGIHHGVGDSGSASLARFLEPMEQVVNLTRHLLDTLDSRHDPARARPDLLASMATGLGATHVSKSPSRASRVDLRDAVDLLARDGTPAGLRARLDRWLPTGWSVESIEETNPRMLRLNDVATRPVVVWGGDDGRDLGPLSVRGGPAPRQPVRVAGDYVAWFERIAPGVTWIGLGRRSGVTIERIHRFHALAAGQRTTDDAPMLASANVGEEVRLVVAWSQVGETTSVAWTMLRPDDEQWIHAGTSTKTGSDISVHLSDVARHICWRSGQTWQIARIGIDNQVMETFFEAEVIHWPPADSLPTDIAVDAMDPSENWPDLAKLDWPDLTSEPRALPDEALSLAWRNRKSEPRTLRRETLRLELRDDGKPSWHLDADASEQEAVAQSIIYGRLMDGTDTLYLVGDPAVDGEFAWMESVDGIQAQASFEMADSLAPLLDRVVVSPSARIVSGISKRYKTHLYDGASPAAVHVLPYLGPPLAPLDEADTLTARSPQPTQAATLHENARILEGRRPGQIIISLTYLGGEDPLSKLRHLRTLLAEHRPQHLTYLLRVEQEDE